MYKVTGSPQLPEYVNYSLRAEDCMNDIQLDPSSSQPQYRVLSMNRRKLETCSRSGTSFSDDISLAPSTSRSTATQDLAEFLKTSSPQDYKRSPGSSSSEDSTSSAMPQMWNFRFLKSSIPKASPTRTTPIPIIAPLPNKNVVSKTTSRGKPYLQIRVDYANNHFGSNMITEVGGPTSLSSGTPSSMCRRDSVVTSSSVGTDSGISPRASCSGELPNLSPRPRNAQESRISLDLATGGRYQQFLDSGFNSKAPSTSTDLEPYLFTSDIVSAGMAELRAFQNLSRMRTPPCSPRQCSIPHSSSSMPHKSPGNSSPHHPRLDSARVRAKSQGASARSSVASDIFDDITDTEFEGTAGPHGQRKKSRKAPPRPGPPPNRSLPSLPEGHGNLQWGLEEKSCGILTVRNSQISFASTIASSIPLDDAESIKSDRRSREERVKARKAKDINHHIQLMRERKQEGGLMDNRGSKVCVGPDSPTSHLSPTSSDSSEAVESHKSSSVSQCRTSGASGHKSNRNSLIAVALSEDSTLSINNLIPKNNNTRTQSVEGFDSRTSENSKPQSPVSPTSPAFVNSSKYCLTREMELEARILAVERKNKMLEQALMAVIRSAVKGQAQRRAELFKANGMEELLDELDLDEFPAVFAAGGQLV